MAKSSVLFDSFFELRLREERTIFAGFVIRIRHSVSFHLNKVMNLRRALGDLSSVPRPPGSSPYRDYS